MTEVRFTLPLLAMTVCGLILFSAGWLAGFGYLYNELRDLRTTAVDARTMAWKNQEAVYEIEKKAIMLDGTVSRMSQDFAEMRLRQFQLSPKVGRR